MKVLSSIMLRHINIVITGKVQGVYYRASALTKAREIGVNGFVQNCKDGSVYLEAEGTDEQLTALTLWCKSGPPSARVLGCEIEPGEVKHYSEFTIKR
jgi:acylphosphatase